MRAALRSARQLVLRAGSEYIPSKSNRIGLSWHLQDQSYSSQTSQAAPKVPATASLGSRWLSDVKLRIGQCVLFGLTPAQTQAAGKILQELVCDWRELLAGSEGFLTDKHRRGMFRRPVAWGEMDSMGHVNNVVYPRYSETGRIEWLQKTARYVDPENSAAWLELGTPRSDGLILQKLTTEFKFPMKYPDHVTVYHKLSREPQPGIDTLAFDVVILSELHQRAAARCVEDIVVYDYRQGKRTALKPFMVDVLQETWRLQQEAKKTNSARVRDLLDRVRGLEKDSWDRPGAVEK